MLLYRNSRLSRYSLLNCTRVAPTIQKHKTDEVLKAVIKERPIFPPNILVGAERMNETKIISVTNDKGGVGKTTTVHNFGYALMKKGYRVLLVDFNAQCDLTAELGIAEPDAENNTLCDAMRP